MEEGRHGGIPSPCSSERWERLNWGSGNGHTVQWTNWEMVKEGEWRRFGQSRYTKDSGNRSGGWLWKSPSSRALSSKWKGSICYTRKKNVRKKWVTGVYFWGRSFHILRDGKIILVYTWLKVKKWKCNSLSRVWLFVTPRTIQSMEFSRPEYWSE